MIEKKAETLSNSPLGDGGLNFTEAALRLKNVVNRTPLTFNHNLSRKYQCNIFLKLHCHTKPIGQ